MMLPTVRTIDTRLVAGSLLFSAGWGLAGVCPGPALVALGADYLQALRASSPAACFVAAIIAGMLVYEWPERVCARSAALTEGATPGARE